MFYGRLWRVAEKRKTIFAQRKRKEIIIYRFGSRCKMRTWHLKEIVGPIHFAFASRRTWIRADHLHLLTFTSATSKYITTETSVSNDWRGNRCQRIWWMVCSNAACTTRLRHRVAAGDGHSMRWLRKRDAVPAVSQCPYHHHPDANCVYASEFINRNNNNYSADGLRQLVNARPVQLCNNVCWTCARCTFAQNCQIVSFRLHCLQRISFPPHHWPIDSIWNSSPYLWSWNSKKQI